MISCLSQNYEKCVDWFFLLWDILPNYAVSLTIDVYARQLTVINKPIFHNLALLLLYWFLCVLRQSKKWMNKQIRGQSSVVFFLFSVVAWDSQTFGSYVACNLFNKFWKIQIFICGRMSCLRHVWSDLFIVIRKEDDDVVSNWNIHCKIK